MAGSPTGATETWRRVRRFWRGLKKVASEPKGVVGLLVVAFSAVTGALDVIGRYQTAVSIDWKALWDTYWTFVTTAVPWEQVSAFLASGWTRLGIAIGGLYLVYAASQPTHAGTPPSAAPAVPTRAKVPPPTSDDESKVITQASDFATRLDRWVQDRRQHAPKHLKDAAPGEAGGAIKYYARETLDRYRTMYEERLRNLVEQLEEAGFDTSELRATLAQPLQPRVGIDLQLQMIALSVLKTVRNS